MLLISLLVWYSRRPDSYSLKDAKRCLVLVLLTLLLLPSDSWTDPCQAEQPKTLSADNQGAGNQAERRLLREGTRISPVTGRVVMLGRRWVFIPTANQIEEDAVANGDSAVIRAYMVANARSRGSRLGGSTSTDALKRFHTVAAPLEGNGAEQAIPFDQIMLQENLMLQRIVEAIRADSTDDHWLVSGKVTEFFGENLLSIEIAQRANNN